MKKLSLFLCLVAILCFVNSVALNAEYPIKENTQQATVVRYVIYLGTPGSYCWYKYRSPYTGMSFDYGSLSDDTDD